MATSVKLIRDNLDLTLKSARQWTSDSVLSEDTSSASLGLELVRILEDQAIPQLDKIESVCGVHHTNSQPSKPSKPLQAIKDLPYSPLKNDEPPYFFVSDNRLYKIGVAPSKKNGYYKKAISLENVKVVLQSLAITLESHQTVTAKQLISSLDSSYVAPSLPEYHVHLTLGALNKAGVLNRDTSSSYSLAAGPISISAWEKALSRLERRPDLILQAR